MQTNVVDDAVQGLVSSDGVNKKRAIHDVTGLAGLADKVHAVTPNKDLSASTPGSTSPSPILGDEKMEKRQKRLAKNREAAQMFRQRQKVYIQDLEKRTTELTAENASLRAKVELQNAENKVIRDQLAYLRSVIGNAVQINMDKMPSGGKGAPGSRIDDPDSQGGQ